MARHTQSADDLDRYVADREAREPGFAMLVENAQQKLRRARQAGERAFDPEDKRTD